MGDRKPDCCDTGVLSENFLEGIIACNPSFNGLLFHPDSSRNSYAGCRTALLDNYVLFKICTKNVIVFK